MADERGDKLADMAEKFLRLNPDLLRDIMSSHFIRIEKLEFSQGRLVKISSVEKHYRDSKQP